LSGGPKLTLAQAEPLYKALSASAFASLYGAQSWAEDMAESFSWYYYTHILAQPFRIELIRGSECFILLNLISARALQNAQPLY